MSAPYMIIYTVLTGLRSSFVCLSKMNVIPGNDDTLKSRSIRPSIYSHVKPRKRTYTYRRIQRLDRSLQVQHHSLNVDVRALRKFAAMHLAPRPALTVMIHRLTLLGASPVVLVV
jgi:hypothetical protein